VGTDAGGIASIVETSANPIRPDQGAVRRRIFTGEQSRDGATSAARRAKRQMFLGLTGTLPSGTYSDFKENGIEEARD